MKKKTLFELLSEKGCNAVMSWPSQSKYDNGDYLQKDCNAALEKERAEKRTLFDLLSEKNIAMQHWRESRRVHII